MQFDTENTPTITIAAYSLDGFTINNALHRSSILIGFDGQIQPWQIKNNQVTKNDLTALASLDYEIMLLGTGWKQHFPPITWMAPFAARNKPLEIMATPAACRTYNILVAEERRVLVALYLPQRPNQITSPFC